MSQAIGDHNRHVIYDSGITGATSDKSNDAGQWWKQTGEMGRKRREEEDGGRETTGWTKKTRRGGGEVGAARRMGGWWQIGRERGGGCIEGWWEAGGWSDEGMGVLAIILHRFTPVRDGWMCNEVWDLGVSTCTWLSLIAFCMYCGMMCSMCVYERERVCVCARERGRSAMVKFKCRPLKLNPYRWITHSIPLDLSKLYSYFQLIICIKTKVNLQSHILNSDQTLHQHQPITPPKSFFEFWYVSEYIFVSAHWLLLSEVLCMYFFLHSKTLKFGLNLCVHKKGGLLLETEVGEDSQVAPALNQH